MSDPASEDWYKKTYLPQQEDVTLQLQLDNTHLTETFHPLEKDPIGLLPHAPGAKLDAGKVRMGLIYEGFAAALEQVAMVGTYGANKYSDNGWKSVSNGKSRYTDAMFRHLTAEFKGEVFDKDTQLLHAAHTAWNALGRLDFILREYYK